MSNANIIHTADWHLRDAHSGLLARGKDFFQAAMSTVDAAVRVRSITGNPTCLVVPGDLLDKSYPSTNVMNELREIHRALIQNELAAFVTIGNHDECYPSWPEVLEPHPQWGLRDITGQTVQWKGRTIVGLPPVPSYVLPDYLQKDQTPNRIVLWHGSLKDFVGFPVQNMLSADDLPLQGISAFLLGDIHKTEYIINKDNCLVGFPGATELCKSDEPLTHTCTHFVVHEDGSIDPTYELIPVAHRPVLTLRITSEETLNDAVHQIKTSPHQKLMVLINYNRSMPNVKDVLNVQCQREGLILRAEAVDDTFSTQAFSFAVMNAKAKELQADKLTMAQVITEAIGEGTPLHGVCISLANPNNNPREILEKFVEELVA